MIPRFLISVRMMEKSKIQSVRDEFERIGCLRPFSPGVSFEVMWTWHMIRVIGKKNMGFDFDVLMYLLADVPDGAGEDVFWAHVSNSDVDKIVWELTQKTWKEWAQAENQPMNFNK